MTEFFTKNKNDYGEHEITVITDDYVKYKAMQKICRFVVDGKIEKPEDVELVRRGEWIPVDGESPCDEWDCSACMERMTFMHEMDEDDMKENFPFCPKCAAKMDGGEENESKN